MTDTIHKVINGFTFFDELDLLEFKLAELGDVIDYFILVEGNVTFSGKSKPYYFEENKHRFLKYLPKIIHVKVDDFPDTLNPWDREKHQRVAIERGFKHIPDLDDNDVFLIGDLDEIPDPDLCRKIKTNEVEYFQIARLRLNLYYYNLNCKSKDDFARIYYAKYHMLKHQFENNQDLDLIMNFTLLRTIIVFGWHFSFFGGFQSIKTKLESFSHCHDKEVQDMNDAYIRECIDENKGLFGHETRDEKDSYLTGEFEYVSLKDNKYLPVHYEMLVTTET
jgi:beta-1,4-mannosyl-glycoprotein beta-1,4-N-acetylglucosaminyltransferase